METTRDLLIIAFGLLLVAGWLVAGRIGLGVSLGVGALSLGVYALLRDVDPDAEAIERARARRTGVQL